MSCVLDRRSLAMHLFSVVSLKDLCLVHCYFLYRYCADLPSLILSSIFSYADDTKIYNNLNSSMNYTRWFGRGDTVMFRMVGSTEHCWVCCHVHILVKTIRGWNILTVWVWEFGKCPLCPSVDPGLHINQICSWARTMVYLFSKCFEKPSLAVVKKIYIWPYLKFADAVCCAELMRDVTMLEFV